MLLNFSPDLPSGCPLPTSLDCGGSVFVLVPALPLEQTQFQSQAERGRAKNAVGDGVCTRHGLSVFPTYESCAHQLKLFPRLGPYIAKAVLSAQDGKIANTPSTVNPAHQTWWPYLEVTRHKLFSVVAL